MNFLPPWSLKSGGTCQGNWQELSGPNDVGKDKPNDPLPSKSQELLSFSKSVQNGLSMRKERCVWKIDRSAEGQIIQRALPTS